MLDHETRTAILKLHGEGHGSRAIAKALNISRGAARRVLEDGRAEVPELERPELLAPELDAIGASLQEADAEGAEGFRNTLDDPSRRSAGAVRAMEPFHYERAADRAHR